jgi:hypothetical protein
VQAVQALFGKPPAPLADGIGIAAELGGNVLVLERVGVGTEQDETSAKGQALGGRTRVSEALQLLGFFRREQEDRGTAGHAARSLCWWTFKEEIASAMRSTLTIAIEEAEDQINSTFPMTSVIV